jgi:hypothetical protein
VSLSFSKDGVCESKALGFEMGNTYKAIEERLDTLHHDLAPKLGILLLSEPFLLT